MTRLRSRTRSIALVLAIAAGLVFAAPVAAAGGYRSVARDSSLGPYYDGVYANFYYNPTNQGGQVCGFPDNTNTTADAPIFDQARIITSSSGGYLFIRIRDGCGGFATWEYGFGITGGSETAVYQNVGAMYTGWHSMAIWRPFAIGFGGGNGSNSRWYFSIDGTQQSAGVNWSAQFDQIEVGVESHAAEPATIISRQTFNSLQYMQASYNQWISWAGQDGSGVSTYMCGRWSGATTWYGGTLGNCLF